jgi:hypothetical protein
MPIHCLSHPDTFYYLCVQLAFKSQEGNVTPLIKKWYEVCFGCDAGDQDKNWILHVCCTTCHTMGKWLVPNAVRRSFGLEGIKGPLIRL